MNFKKEIYWLIEEKYKGQLTSETKKDIKRVKKGEPIDYVIGWRDFLNCKIDLSLKPLIPRVETEYWVEKVIAKIKNFRDYPEYIRFTQYKLREGTQKNFRALDIFSGSGCIGIALLKNFPRAKVDFADNNEKFLKQIKINLKLNKIKSSRYRIIKSNVFSKISGKPVVSLANPYDYIFANPPYIDKNQPANLLIQKSVLKYEPKSALFAANKGMFYIEKFLKRAGDYLKPDGQIYMEFGFGQKSKIQKLVKKFGYKNVLFLKDQFNRYRYIVIQG